jgi:hypothetical protein
VIDTLFERWAAQSAARAAANAPLLAAGLDPTCEGCRTHFRTQGMYMARHTCAKRFEEQAYWVLCAYERARGSEGKGPRSKARKVAPTPERLREELGRLRFIQDALLRRVPQK